jgi:crossover junction endodeoxyribonuclease RusA
MNDRLHYRPHAAIVANIRATIVALAVDACIPPLEHATVVMTWTVPDLRVRDVENPVATYKPTCDALVTAGVVPDDSPVWMTKVMPVITYEKGVAAVRFEVTGIAA